MKTNSTIPNKEIIDVLNDWIKQAEKTHHPNLKHVACSVCQRIKKTKQIIKQLDISEKV